MIECIIIGDSIALGVAQYRQECVVHAQTGITTKAWNDKYPDILKAKQVIISLGSNDPSYNNKELNKVRTKVTADEVFWIVPANKPSNDISKEYHDTNLKINKLSSDKVHPTLKGYEILANQTK